MFKVVITGPAKLDIQSAYDWWAKNRSAADAIRWYTGIFESIKSLEDMPERCPLAPETALVKQGLRQLHYGIGASPTHRIVFTIDENEVVVLRIRHSAQDRLDVSELNVPG